MKITRAEAAAARQAAIRQATDRPSARRNAEERGSLATVIVPLELRDVVDEELDGRQGVRLALYASVTEQPYDMYDFWGPYREIVSRGAFGATLAASPLVEFTVNHGAGGGLPMAHTRNGTLALGEDEIGLLYQPFVDPTRSDVADMLKAYERGDIVESSFKFRIDSGKWSPDYEEFRIDAVDLNRGDVSIVNFGANPFTADFAQNSAPTPMQGSRRLLEAKLALALADD